LKDEELVELIAASGGRFIFIGLESINPQSLKSAHKQFNRPEEYSGILSGLAARGIYTITSFIVGMEDDHPGVASSISSAIDTWPPVLPVFGLLTPYPGTPLYDRLQKEGRLIRPEHWLDFKPFRLTFKPNHLSGSQSEDEVNESWRLGYGRHSFARTQRWLIANRKPFDHQVAFLVARLLFRGIYFSQSTPWSWVRLLASNSTTIARLVLHRLLERPSRPKTAAIGTDSTEKLTEKIRRPRVSEEM
jgi:radical SAM superfamily enzyme YgiQ (UPF0313 family)